jgi:hypothetical protein
MDIDKAKSNGKISGISLKKLQEMAVHMNIPKSQPKGKLVDAIREKILKKRELSEIELVQSATEG